MIARVVLHLPEDYHDRFRRAPHLALYARVAEVIEARGGEVVLRGRGKRLFERAAVAGDGDLHLVENGRAWGPGWLNGALAYLPGYWHLDPAGVLAESSIAGRVYDPEAIPADEAAAFLAGLRARFVAPRISRYGQKKASEDVPEGAIVVFLQGPIPERRGQAHLSTREMLRAVADGAAGRPVVVKAHPLKPEVGLAAIAEVQAEGHALQVSDANVHDLLAGCAVTVSINSAASIEGLMHGKPAILFGRADFAALAETVTHRDGFSAALDRALMRRIDGARALTWYFDRNCLWLEAPDFAERMLAVFEQAGFGAGRLGLRPG